MKTIEEDDYIIIENNKLAHNECIKEIQALFLEELALIFMSAFPNLNEAHIREVVFDKSKNNLIAINSKNDNL